MDIRISPARLSGKLHINASKSDAHRLLICAALSQRESRLILNDPNADIEATINCLTAMGASFDRQGSALRVAPIASPVPMPECDCHESGSTLRFLVPVAAALGGGRFTGQGKLGQRPMADILRVLSEHGASNTGSGLPLLQSGGLTGGRFSIRGDVSSQFVSGLLFALPLLHDAESVISLTSPLESAGYVDMTLGTLKRFGISVRQEESAFLVPGNQRYNAPAEELIPEGDWSSAAFWIGANALGSNITLTGLNTDSMQSDKQITGLADQLPSEIDLRDIPDLLPILSVIACKKKETTRFTHAARLRLKESDRLSSCEDMIVSLGGRAKADEDCFEVYGTGTLKGGHVKSWNDHRIVMAAAVAACISITDVTIQGAEAVGKSYPNFFKDYTALGGKVYGI